MKLFDIANRWI